MRTRITKTWIETQERITKEGKEDGYLSDREYAEAMAELQSLKAKAK